ncbi:MAG TPA: NAD-dependent DNA ligase LigA, partial [Thermoanaerobaculia bacterium]|nr:NAD-dependent DNA ligase LigA [Thermoanaerobaculia bacterium]
MPRVPKKPPPGARPRESGRAALVPPEAARRAEELRQELARHERLYYVENRPEITDAQFDVLLRELLALEEKYPEFARSDSLTRRVGGRPAESFATVEHATPMLSLENAYTWEEAEAWLARA